MSSNANILQRLESIADDPESLKQYPITPEILSIYKTTMLGLINKALLAYMTADLQANCYEVHGTPRACLGLLESGLDAIVALTLLEDPPFPPKGLEEIEAGELARYEILMKARATYGMQLGKEGAASVIRAVFPRSAKS